MSDAASNAASDSSSSSDSSSLSSSAKRKKIKKEEKKLKKIQKKVAKKEKKQAKKEKKKAKKEAKKDKKDKKDKKEKKRKGSDGEETSVVKKSRSVGDAATGVKLKDGLSLAEAVEAAALGLKTGTAKTVEDDEVTVHSSDGRKIDDPDVFKTFKEIREFPRKLQEAFLEAKFPAPSQIQAYCWPLGLRGKDIIGIAATGSGKTLGFLLPAFVQMDEERIDPQRDGPGLLVMSPTRELAQQTDTEAKRFGKCFGFRSVSMYGGAPKGEQMSKYRAGCACIVACPGRLNDFLEGRQVNLRNTKKLVLDEADRMLDMGFEPQIRKILAQLPSKRHTLFFTATWPKQVRSLADEILHKPYKVMIGQRDELKANQDVTQMVKVMEPDQKVPTLGKLLSEAGLGNTTGKGKALVFCNTKKLCEQLCNCLTNVGVPCASIHGDKDQQQRDYALNGLRDGRIRVLVATDVAARGLDIKGVGLVVNYDPANNTEDYVHRSGRTGRAGAKGFAVTFLTRHDATKAKGIMEVIERTGQPVPDELASLANSASRQGKEDRRR
eukprot:TRINITY_DN2929_c1_g3_i1.p1 TRINITY_DN2929_c1_g3~~TRINITY_DN2929_c1_g3_i1.p1  ORF type:complete len:551 (+),score=140.98 TRINITY_DN2929_c1_g3_i1:118-1770(+)